jgi:hypothetical protein
MGSLNPSYDDRFGINRTIRGYWMPAFAGMTAESGTPDPGVAAAQRRLVSFAAPA